jgi:hypothetical protein
MTSSTSTQVLRLRPGQLSGWVFNKTPSLFFAKKEDIVEINNSIAIGFWLYRGCHTFDENRNYQT